MHIQSMTRARGRGHGEASDGDGLWDLQMTGGDTLLSADGRGDSARDGKQSIDLQVMWIDLQRLWGW